MIELTNLTENQKEWFKSLLQNEISEARAASANEHIWALGSDDGEAEMHEANAEEQSDYACFLEEVLSKVLEGEF